MPSRRIFQVNELLRQEISGIILTELSDPRFSQVTVTSVNSSPDLQHAKVYVNYHGSEHERADCIEALNKAAGRVRHLVGQRVRMKYIPELRFVYDDRLDYAETIYKKLDEIHKNQPSKPKIENEVQEGENGSQA